MGSSEPPALSERTPTPPLAGHASAPVSTPTPQIPSASPGSAGRRPAQAGNSAVPSPGGNRTAPSHGQVPSAIADLPGEVTAPGSAGASSRLVNGMVALGALGVAGWLYSARRPKGS